MNKAGYLTKPLLCCPSRAMAVGTSHTQAGTKAVAIRPNHNVSKVLMPIINYILHCAHWDVWDAEWPLFSSCAPPPYVSKFINRSICEPRAVRICRFPPSHWLILGLKLVRCKYWTCIFKYLHANGWNMRVSIHELRQRLVGLCMIRSGYIISGNTVEKNEF